MNEKLTFCPCCEAITRAPGLCWNCSNEHCDVCAAEICERCDAEFGSVRDDGSHVERIVGDVLCEPCRNVRDNAAEEAWMQRENDRFFGGQS